MVGNQLFYGKTDGTFYARTFDGTTFGRRQQVDPYNDPAWANVDNGVGGPTAAPCPRSTARSRT